MATPARRTGRRRRRAKIIVDFATGEVHDRALDAAADSATRAGAIGPSQSVYDAAANRQSRRARTKARKTP